MHRLTYANVAATLALIIAVAGGTTLSPAQGAKTASSAVRSSRTTSLQRLTGIRVVEVDGRFSAFAPCARGEKSWAAGQLHSPGFPDLGVSRRREWMVRAARRWTGHTDGGLCALPERQTRQIVQPAEASLAFLRRRACKVPSGERDKRCQPWTTSFLCASRRAHMGSRSGASPRPGDVANATRRWVKRTSSNRPSESVRSCLKVRHLRPTRPAWQLPFRRRSAPDAPHEPGRVAIFEALLRNLKRRDNLESSCTLPPSTLSL